MLQEFPKIQHLPWSPNVQSEDHVAEINDVENLFTLENIVIQEKVDGANCSIMWNDGNPEVRGRTRRITKGRVKNTPANEQFRPIWNWIYEHKHMFEQLNSMLGGPVGVYGDWMLAKHGIEYDQLPSYFIPYEIWLPEKRQWVIGNEQLQKCGFYPTPIIHKGLITNVDMLTNMSKQKSVFSTIEQHEGIVVKVINNGFIERRYKMVRTGFVQGSLWNESSIDKQKLIKG